METLNLNTKISENSLDEHIGTKEVKDYVLTKILGQGTFGIVYLG